MSAQTTYNFSTDKGVAGGIFDLSPNTIDARRNECEDSILKFGVGVVVGTSAGNQVKLPEAGATVAKFEGIVVNGFSTELNRKGELAIEKDATVGVLRKGRIWARLVDGITPAYGDALYLVISGANAGLFTNATGDNAIAITNAKFIGTKGTGNVAPVELA